MKCLERLQISRIQDVSLVHHVPHPLSVIEITLSMACFEQGTVVLVYLILLHRIYVSSEEMILEIFLFLAIILFRRMTTQLSLIDHSDDYVKSAWKRS